MFDKLKQYYKLCLVSIKKCIFYMNSNEENPKINKKTKSKRKW